MTSGLTLVEAARAAVAQDGSCALPLTDDLSADVERAAIVATLLTLFTHDDALLVVALTDQECLAEQRPSDEVLLACCWLLFMIGRVEDSSVIWRAKNLDFDTQ